MRIQNRNIVQRVSERDILPSNTETIPVDESMHLSAGTDPVNNEPEEVQEEISINISEESVPEQTLLSNGAAATVQVTDTIAKKY